MCHLKVRTVDDPVSKIVRKLYLRYLSGTWIFFSVKYRDEPGQTPFENQEIQNLSFDDCRKLIVSVNGGRVRERERVTFSNILTIQSHNDKSESWSFCRVVITIDFVFT